MFEAPAHQRADAGRNRHPLPKRVPQKVDALIVGGGLAGCLIAWRLAVVHPHLNWILLERASELAGTHTWCFHDSDVSREALLWMRPLISKSWPRHSLRFPEGEHHERETGYNAIRSEDLNKRIQETHGERLYLGRSVSELRADGVTLETGERIESACVIDARGFHPNAPHARAAGWQKFVGLDVRLTKPHGLSGPILMDAEVEQIGGFRFLYSLPFSETELLIEDTVYATEPSFDVAEFETRIRSYADSRGWKIEAILRTEKGCLPIPITDPYAESAMPEMITPQDEAPAIGAAAGFFHATTGYSLPDTVRLIDTLVTRPELTSESLARAVACFRDDWQPRQDFYRLLNRMLFRTIPEQKRYVVLRHFYRLPPAIVERFYAGQTTWADRLKILANRPPVSMSRAIRCVVEHSLGTT